MSKTLVCAIQIGTSRFCATAAWRDQYGSYEIVALDQEASDGCVRRGCIVDIEKAASIIKNLISKLSGRVKSDDCLGIEAAYVGINGISMHNMPHNPSVSLEEGKSIDNDVLAALRQKSLQHYIPSHDILGIEPVGYTLDEVDCIDPSGHTGAQLTAHHQLIVAQQRLRLAVRSAMKIAGVRLVDVLATPLCTAKILTPEEKQRGCVLVDIGHSLTAVSIYADGFLQHLVTIPLGSNSVTQDLVSAKNITREEAEKEKIEQAELDIVSRCRFEEIAANVKNQIDLVGCGDRIEAGCILTGGGSLQKGITTLFSERLGISHIETRAFSGITFGISARKPQLSALTTMIAYCTADCSIEPTIVEEEVQEQDTPVADNPESKKPEKPEETEKEEKKDSGINFGTGNRRSGFKRFIEDLFSNQDYQ